MVTRFKQMVWMPWDLLRNIVDGGIDAEYDAYFVAHPVPKLIDPDEPAVAKDDDDDVDDDRGGGRGRRQRRGETRKVVRDRDG